jgi:predicted ATPase/class 3 adenylate cyclase
MPAQPIGMVTLLFTDIEGSTRLLERLGTDRYTGVLELHRQLLREAFARHDGYEFGTEGDALFVAFASAPDAVAAAEEGQQALAGASWPDNAAIKVRMGIHTGEPLASEANYVGMDVHRTARIMSAGHGGQVVVSAATRALVDGELTELGEHRLKDFDESVPLFQLGSERYPPLKTLSNTNLPRPVSSFVGREQERGELVAMLSDGTRLVTLSGPGGAGKTRLALETASELVPWFKAGVFWVGLAAIRDPAVVVEAISQTLGAKNGLAEHIGQREQLLLLDNFEQVVEAAPALGTLLESCPNLKLLVTSRELLRIDGEVAYPLPPLTEGDALALFCERSRVDPDETITKLCRRLDDLPLAIELAAARTMVLSPAQILDRLSQRLDLLRGGRGADPRQQTLRATIEWSHDLLDTMEQRLFAEFAVFRGGATLESVEAVVDADLDTLQSLVDKSLLRHTGERFWMLETIREYAGEHLALLDGESDVRRRHAACALAIAERADYEMNYEHGDQVEGLARIGAEHDNLRAALEWATDAGEDEMLLRLAASLQYFWGVRGFLHDKERWSRVALERSASPPRARMTVLNGLARLAMDSGDHARADTLVAECRSLAEREGDEALLLGALNVAARNASLKGDLDGARAELLALRAKAGEVGDHGMVAITTINLGDVASQASDFRTAFDHAAEAVALFRKVGDDGGVAVSLEACGWAALALAEPAVAEQAFRESVVIFDRLGSTRYTATSALGLAASLVASQRDEHGVSLLAAAASLREEFGLEFGNETEEQAHDQALADARASLSEEPFAQAWARGETMTPADIVAFAQAEPRAELALQTTRWNPSH